MGLERNIEYNFKICMITKNNKGYVVAEMAKRGKKEVAKRFYNLNEVLDLFLDDENFSVNLFISQSKENTKYFKEKEDD